MVVHFGGSAPAGWTPKRFPKLVLLHMGPLPVVGSLARSFNFNKMRAMIVARIKVGVQLDADQFVAPGVDAIFGARWHTKSTLSAALPTWSAFWCSVSRLRLRARAVERWVVPRFQICRDVGSLCWIHNLTPAFLVFFWAGPVCACLCCHSMA